VEILEALLMFSTENADDSSAILRNIFDVLCFLLSLRRKIYDLPDSE
jgi:hypothetical protein